MLTEDKVFVVGHKNPDTDSICSAIAYAYLKNQASGSERYVACRAGQINEETEFVLNYFGLEPPFYLPNVGQQVKDMQIEETEGAPDTITVRIAWEYMKESGTTTLPIMDSEDCLIGLLTVGDIANYYMDSYTKTIMAEAKTKYYDIADTINGVVVSGNAHSYFTSGKVMVGAAMPDQLVEQMEADDLIITGNRSDAQLAAIQNGASCIVVCLSDDCEEEVKRVAKEAECIVICTRFDTYTVSRLITQSIPARYLMKKSGIVSFTLEDYVDDIRDTMSKTRYRSFPVLDYRGRYVGMIGRRSILTARRKQLILVDHTEKSQAVDNLDEAEILEIIDHHRIGTVETLQPVYFRGEPVGCTATILTSMFHEQNIPIPKHIAGLLASAIVSDTLLYRSPTCTPRDVAAGNELAAIAGIDLEAYAKKMFKAGSDLSGKNPEEIIHQDFKKFIFGETVFGVGQISSMDMAELLEIAERITPELQLECGKNGMQMVFFMLTDILTEDTTLLYFGQDAEALIRESFEVEPEEGHCLLKGVVSRKKQLIPAFMQAIQNR